jgi:membrane protease YdiL (CAAX protease family)
MQIARDRQLGAAFGAAPFFWLLLLWFRMPAPDLYWPWREPVLFLMPVVVYPVLEEMTFRGLLQPALHRYPSGGSIYGGMSLANWVTSLCFAASHLLWHTGWQALAVVLPSLVFGYFRDRYGRITPSVALHVFYNAGFVWLFAWPSA